MEKDASLLIRATDAFAKDSREHSKLGYTNGGPNAEVPPRLLLPLIVTNAKIHTARYKPPDVSLETGEFMEPPKEVEKAPWVRFSKSFTADRGRDVGYRSIFVVNAIQLEEFLTHLELAPDQQQPSSV